MVEATTPADEGPRRSRNRAETDRQIRSVARTLLVNHGPESVTLRAIAREMGITAPALYRYYASFEDLIQHVCGDICADLAAELTDRLAAIPPEDMPARVFTVCRGFRQWAIKHPREFSLVFANPAAPQSRTPDWPYAPGDPATDRTDPFGRIFLIVAGQVLSTRKLKLIDDAEVPEQLREELGAFVRTLYATVAASGLVVPEGTFTLGAAYTMLRFWVRLYGQVALEVFGRFPFFVSDPEPLFESMVAELAAEVGLTKE